MIVNDIKIYSDKVPPQDLDQFAKDTYGDMVKGVVDLRHRSIALGGDLHADCEKLLLEHGSSQADLWGFNIYPQKPKESRLQYNSLINIRPKQGNYWADIQDEQLQKKIKLVVDALID